MTPTARTLPFILERLRDVDAINRRCVYLGSLSHNMLAQPGAAALEVHEWGDVVKTGLGEREESVRRAARKLVCGWVDRDADLEKVSVTARAPHAQLLMTCSLLHALTLSTTLPSQRQLCAPSSKRVRRCWMPSPLTRASGPT